MSQSRAHTIWQRILYCDPRVLYALFACLVVLCEFWRPRMPVPVPPAARKLYDVIERLPHDKLVIIDCELAASIRAECEGQFVAVVRHLFKRGLPFAIMMWTTQAEGIKFGTDLSMKLAEEYGKEYGRDFVIWNAITPPPAGGAMLQAFAKDIPGMIQNDIFGTPLDRIACMRGVKDISDISLIFKVSYVWNRAEVPWIGFIQSVYGTPYAAGCVAIQSSDAYPYVDAGQICGLLAGAAGAAAYEHLLAAPGIGTATVSVQSFAALFVFVAIVCGNIAMLMARRARGEEVAA
jgi:hypothetical protein